MDVNPNTEKRHWVLTVKIWYKVSPLVTGTLPDFSHHFTQNNMPPSTKMIPLDYVSCSIRLSDVFIVTRTLRPAGYTHFRMWNRFTTDWETRSLHDDLAVSIADNHTLLIRLPTVATLLSWPENISQAYGACQTVDPRRQPSSKGKDLAYD